MRWDHEPAMPPDATVPDLVAWIGPPPGDRLWPTELWCDRHRAARPPSSDL